MISIKAEESINDLREYRSVFPFQSLWFQKTYARYFCKREDLIFVSFYDSKKYIGYGTFEKVDNNKIVFLGMKQVENGQEVTDYGDICLTEEGKASHKEIWEKLIQWFSEKNIELIQLDYVRSDSLTYELFKDQAVGQTVAPYIALPKNWDDYLSSLDRVDRKELKRKIRRLESVTFSYKNIGTSIENDFEEFIRLHKLSSGEKDKFMTDTMKKFFWDLVFVEKQDWKTTFSFLQIENKNVSAVLNFENELSVLAYNSGYDPLFNYYSAGLLLHAFKIKEAIEKGKTIYDFLRGTERYKYDLGGKDMMLYRISIPLKK